MGFKRTNYKIEEIGLTIPEAYAVIKNINIYGEKGTAEFAIQTSRENAIKLAPLKTVYIDFKANRNESPYVTAYNLAKSLQTEKRGAHTVTHEMPFYGWTDDFAGDTL